MPLKTFCSSISLQSISAATKACPNAVLLFPELVHYGAPSTPGLVLKTISESAGGGGGGEEKRVTLIAYGYYAPNPSNSAPLHNTTESTTMSKAATVPYKLKRI
jgi:hypothetical protein